VETLREEGCPIIWNDAIQCLGEFLEGERHDLGTRVASLTKEESEEVIERFFITALIANDRIDLQPDQFALTVEIEAAEPPAVIGSAAIHRPEGGSHGCRVLEIAPHLSRTMIEFRCSLGKLIQKLLSRPDSRTHRQYV